MRTIKLTIEYDGTNFSGWQIQPGNQRTVQGEIERALSKILSSPTKIIGAGRTDTGAHAAMQVAHFKTSSTLDCATIINALNAHLKNDIVILDAQEVKSDFHAQYSVKSKVYRYTIVNRPQRSALTRFFALHYPYKLNISRMKQEAKALIGRKDFKAFQGSNRDQKLKPGRGTVRTIKRITITKKSDTVTIDIEADGFLYKMVRNIVGTLLETGSGKLPKDSLAKILKSKDRNKGGATAKAHGLCLQKITY